MLSAAADQIQANVVQNSLDTIQGFLFDWSDATVMVAFHPEHQDVEDQLNWIELWCSGGKKDDKNV